MDLTELLVLATAIALVGGILVGAAGLLRWWQGRRVGRLEWTDGGQTPGALLRSERWGLVGRPDEIRRRGNGELVPVEWKSGGAPRGGPYPSHRLQVNAYCALLEESSGPVPRFGLLHYGDGTEFRVPWDAEAQGDLERVLEELRRPYDGRATPGRAKCAACRYRSVCDARVT